MGNIKNAREAKGMGQQEVALALGVSQPTVSDWESNKKTPNGDNLKRLSDLLNVTTDYLLGRTDIPYTSSHPDDDEVWELRDMLHKRPEIKTLLHASQKVTREDIEKVSALVDSLKKTNPEFGGEE